MGAALDSTAGLIKLVATLALNGRDKELSALIATNLPDDRPEGSKHASPVGSIKGGIASGRGVGRETILSIYAARKVEVRDKLIREAVATLKASGEHDRIIADVAAQAQERAEQEARAAEKKAAEAKRAAEEAAVDRRRRRRGES